MLILANDVVCSAPMLTLVGYIKGILRIIQILIPIGLIVWGTLDLGKAVIAGKEEDIKENQQVLLKRVLAAVLVFFVITIVMFVMGFVGNEEWEKCWNEATPKGSLHNPVES